jgi:H(+)-translocating pyrophosphatase
MDDSAVSVLVLLCVFLGLAFALVYAHQTSKIQIIPSDSDSRNRLLDGKNSGEHNDILREVAHIQKLISEGANAFLFAEYLYMAVFIAIFSVLLVVVLGFLNSWRNAGFATLSFIVGALTSILCGYLGMRIAVYSNARTAVMAMPNGEEGYSKAFVTAFKAGCVMGFTLVSLGILNLFILINIVKVATSGALTNMDITRSMYESIAGYGLGGSSVALFGRVGGGIYTKAADVGADLVGKVENALNEDSPKNPAVIADNVGDNVGDIAGMGADLFGSFAESSCASMVIASSSPQLFSSWPALCFPLGLCSCGIIVCFFTTFVSTHLYTVRDAKYIEPSLKLQIGISTALMTPTVYIVCYYFLPSSFVIGDKTIKNWYVFFCVACGLWSGMVIGFMTEYYTSNRYTPVQEVANACKTGAATNIIFGLALGYKSVIVPVFCMAVTIYVSYSLAGMFGIAAGALGILSTLPISLTIDAYGPICDNAGGIAEMAGMPESVRHKTDALDAAGNTTAAIGKGFAIASAALVSLALFGAFVTTVKLEQQGVNILQPFQFAGLLVGAMLPYWFSAMTMKSVGKAALDMVEEVRDQIRKEPKILEGTVPPNYQRCISISTAASLREMILPGALVMCTPIVVGFLFGVKALSGILAGALVSGVQMAISSSNTGGAWDNAKKFIEAGGIEGERKGGQVHKAAVIGDTVGDPLKDTSGPSLNILIKLMAIISLVFAPAFPSIDKGGLLQQLFS